MDYYGWDIGGAHLKVARLNAHGDLVDVRQMPCALWQGLARLDEALVALDLPPERAHALHAITMTGELCDLFADRQDGVRQILAHFLPRLGPRVRARVYGGARGWLTPAQAVSEADAVASANWRALADYVAEFVADAVLVDIGSTTTDIALIDGGAVVTRGHDDATRLAAGELVYTGVVRTPVLALARAVPYAGQWQGLAAEVFATTADVYRLLGELDEAHDQQPSADGRAKDLPSSARRLARMVGRDFAAADLPALTVLARHLAACQLRALEDALDLQLSRVPAQATARPLIGAGAGSFLAAALARARGLDFRGFGLLAGASAAQASAVALAAPAVAVARLAALVA